MSEQLKGEWRRGVYREVLRRGDVLVKRFLIPPKTPRVKPVWLREHEAFERLGSPQSFGVRERSVPRGGGARLVLFRRAFVEGEVQEQLDPVELAGCLAKMHAVGVVGLDPHPGNFLRCAETGELCMIDLGRAACSRPGSWRLLVHVGHELYRVRRESWNAGDSNNAVTHETFLQAYRAARPEGWWLVRLSAAGYFTVRRSRLRCEDSKKWNMIKTILCDRGLMDASNGRRRRSTEPCPRISGAAAFPKLTNNLDINSQLVFK